MSLTVITESSLAALHQHNPGNGGLWTVPVGIGVYDVLRKDSYNVAIVQNPATSLADDVAATKRIIATRNDPGHSCQALLRRGGDHKRRATIQKVAGLVSITAFAPDKGESVSTPIKAPPPGAPMPPILPPQDVYLFLDRAKFHASFAANVEAEKAAFMADSQVPWGIDALSGTINEPVWKTKPISSHAVKELRGQP